VRNLGFCSIVRSSSFSFSEKQALLPMFPTDASIAFSDKVSSPLMPDGLDYGHAGQGNCSARRKQAQNQNHHQKAYNVCFFGCIAGLNRFAQFSARQKAQWSRGQFACKRLFAACLVLRFSAFGLDSYPWCATVPVPVPGIEVSLRAVACRILTEYVSETERSDRSPFFF
jgi:hypothetical protein